METPNTKHQKSNNLQLSNTDESAAGLTGLLEFESCGLFGVWCLVFGVLSS
jgi:hypothetical protein